jgi:hypothetical protein
MSVAGSINSLSGIDVSYISSAEDAIALASVVQLGVSEELRKFLKGEIEAKNNLSDIIKNFSVIKSQLTSLLSQPISKVTPQSLRDAGTSSAALSELFNGDGIRLASNFNDSSAALQTLQEQGVNLSTSVEFPVFQENYNSDGKLVSESVSWINPEINNLLGKFLTSAPSDKYTNATVYYFGKPGKSEQITVFNDLKNIRVDAQSVNGSLVQAQDKYDTYLDALNKSITKINTAAGKLNDAIEDVSKVTATQQKILADLRNSRGSFTDQVLQTRRIDRINFLNKLEQTNQLKTELRSNNPINNDSILEKNNSKKIENLSPIPDWKSIETKSNPSLENKIFQVESNVTNESLQNKAPQNNSLQNKSIPYLNVGKTI